MTWQTGDPFSTVLRDIEHAYAPAAPGEVRDSRESIAALEFLLRFTSLLAISTLRSAGVEVPKLNRSPGFGTWVETLKSLNRNTAVATGNVLLATQVRTTLEELVRLQSEGPGKGVPFGSFKELRDHLSHSGPTNPSWDGLLDAPVRRIWDAVARSLEGIRIEIEQGGPEQHPILVKGKERVNLFPLFYTSKGGTWQVFSAFNRKKPSFLSYGGTRNSTHPSADDTVTQLERLLQKPGKQDAARSHYCSHVREDLESFQEKGSRLYDEDLPPELASTGFLVTWSQAVSSGAEERTDHFRIGPDDRREWRSANGQWVSYGAFLRTIANLPVAARRLQWAMDELEDQMRREESAQLGWSSDVVLRPATVVVRDAVLRTNESQPPKPQDFKDLIEQVDTEVGAQHTQTLLYFVNGEAGIGKTRAMLTAARDRATELGTVSDVAEITRPLLLYVRSNGRVLTDLSEAVNHAATETRNLTYPVVETLCRNGVLVLLVDGFDELVGGAGFNDAVGDLQPWLTKLNGRGVVIVSARSSYYENQFRESLRRAEELGEKVHHRIAEIRKWGKEQIWDFLAANGITESQRSGISPDDWELLGLPFFARSFVELVRQGRHIPGGSSDLMGQLVTNYLIREEQKLQGDSGGSAPLLTRIQIAQLFESLVDCMVDNKELEADLEEVELSAAMVLGVDDPAMLEKDHPHLKNRLPVLCGIDVSARPGDGSSRRFRFQHELFFDYFLAGLAIGHVQRGETRSLHRLLRVVEWRSAMTRRVASEVGPEELDHVLLGFDPAGSGGPSTDSSAQAAATATRNLGSLWSASMRVTGQVPATGIKDVTFADPVDLSWATDHEPRFVRCSLPALTLPSGKNWSIHLESGTSVQVLTVPQGCTDLSRLHGLQHRDLMELHLVGRESRYRRPEILDALRKLRADIVDDVVAETAATPVAVDAATYYLRYIAYYVTGPMTFQAGNFLPDDQRLKWVNDYEGEWKPFVDALVKADLAVALPIAASGNRKVRLRLQIGAVRILDQDSEDPRVQEFWRGRRSA